ncbi:hypothetical protein [Lacrimispora sp.]|uniref:hypothetical protein n=1 Tax=Lacrimispora sp. TaxID=2719234 RepID=UPI0028A873D5|nr:hypothetical protein [Lacrimispora sp.]
MKIVDDFKMIRKGDTVRKYTDSSMTTYRDYEVIQGGKAAMGGLIYIQDIKSGGPEWVNIYDIVKLVN